MKISAEPKPKGWSHGSARKKDPKAKVAYNAYMREYRQRPGVRERILKRQQEWNKSERGQALKKRWHLKRYDITPEEYEQVFDAQGRCCAICGTDRPGKKGWCTDHCHKTGKFRGVLCTPCNLGLGYFKDDDTKMQKAIEYVRRNK